MRNNPLLNLALALFILLATGWLLYIGRPIILPLVTALITVYVMISASNALHRQPLFRRLPQPVLRFFLVTVFAGVIMSLAVISATTIREIASLAPVYEANIDGMLETVAVRFGLDRQAMWDELRQVTIEAFNLRTLFLGLLGGFTDIGGTLFLIVLYTAFLISERGGFETKVAAAFKAEGQAEKVLDVTRTINSRVRDYLAIKTLINVILATISFVVLWLHGTDFALFWALLIGLLNYIPYIGSYVGVFFPVVLSVAQFASLPMTLSLTLFLTLAQVMVGSYLEPKLVGRQVNLSPIVVLVALSVWTALWGVPGAILAVPMTSVLAIILANFEETKPFAILLADTVTGAEDSGGREGKG